MFQVVWSTNFCSMEDTDGGLHPAVDGQNLDEVDDEFQFVAQFTETSTTNGLGSLPLVSVSKGCASPL